MHVSGISSTLTFVGYWSSGLNAHDSLARDLSDLPFQPFWALPRFSPVLHDHSSLSLQKTFPRLSSGRPPSGSRALPPSSLSALSSHLRSSKRLVVHPSHSWWTLPHSATCLHIAQRVTFNKTGAPFPSKAFPPVFHLHRHLSKPLSCWPPGVHLHLFFFPTLSTQAHMQRRPPLPLPAFPITTRDSDGRSFMALSSRPFSCRRGWSSYSPVSQDASALWNGDIAHPVTSWWNSRYRCWSPHYPKARLPRRAQAVELEPADMPQDPRISHNISPSRWFQITVRLLSSIRTTHHFLPYQSLPLPGFIAVAAILSLLGFLTPSSPPRSPHQATPQSHFYHTHIWYHLLWPPPRGAWLYRDLSFRQAPFSLFHVTMKGPMAVMMDVFLSSTPVLRCVIDAQVSDSQAWMSAFSFYFLTATSSPRGRPVSSILKWKRNCSDGRVVAVVCISKRASLLISAWPSPPTLGQIGCATTVDDGRQQEWQVSTAWKNSGSRRWILASTSAISGRLRRTGSSFGNPQSRFVAAQSGTLCNCIGGSRTSLSTCSEFWGLLHRSG